MKSAHRRVLRIGLGALLAAVIAVAAAIAWSWPRWLDGPDFEAKLRALFRAETGRALSYEALEVRWLPPRVEIVGPRLAGVEPADLPLLRGGRVRLDLAPLPLLVGELAARRAILDGVAIALVRDASPREPALGGVLWPVAIRNSRVLLEDRSQPHAPLQIELDRVEGDLTTTPWRGRFELDLRAVPSWGGRIHLKGAMDAFDGVELVAKFEEIELSRVPWRSLTHSSLASLARRAVEGALTGTITLSGNARSFERAIAELAIAGAVVSAFGGRERAELEAVIALDLAATPRGRVDIEARLDRGGEVRASGAWRDGALVDTEAELSDVAIAHWIHRLPDVRELSGLVDGRVRVSGPLMFADSVDLDLHFRNGRVAYRDIALRGDAELAAQLDGEKLRDMTRPTVVGGFSVDATAAALDYEGIEQKPAHIPARLSGEIVRGEDGHIAPGDLHLQLRDLR